jgi:NTE family protein
MKRRDFLKLCIASSLLTACEMWQVKGKIGLALGGGGAKGLAHILMLQVLDELNLRPHRIAGTSIGAIMGALYASGMSGKEIQQLIDRLTISKDESWFSGLFEEDVGRWWDIIEIQLGSGGLVDTHGLATFLREIIHTTQFEDLNIPLKVVAADFWERTQVVFDRGDLFPALQASIALPGLFSPMHYKGRVLVDGGLVNPVPYDLLFDECEVVVAIDVLGNRTPRSDTEPGYFENTFNTFQIMQASILREKIKNRPPHIFIHPDLNNIRVLDFNRFEEIYEQAIPARNELRRALRYYQILG